MLKENHAYFVKSKGKWQSVADIGAILLFIQTRVLV